MIHNKKQKTGDTGVQKMRFFKKLGRVHIIFIVAVVIYSLALVSIAQAVTTGSAEPGSDANPLVAQDYVDSKVENLTAKINELSAVIEDLNKQVADLKEGAGGSKFEAVEVKAGKQLVAGASTEIVIRSGKATAVGSANGGLSDLIAGVDIPTGGNIPLNHLLLVSRDDGRGFKVKSDVWILIKGEYTIK